MTNVEPHACPELIHGCPELILDAEIDMMCVNPELGGLFGLDKSYVDNEVLDSVNNMVPNNWKPYLTESFLNGYDHLYNDYIPDIIQPVQDPVPTVPTATMYVPTHTSSRQTVTASTSTPESFDGTLEGLLDPLEGLVNDPLKDPLEGLVNDPLPKSIPSIQIGTFLNFENFENDKFVQSTREIPLLSPSSYPSLPPSPPPYPSLPPSTSTPTPTYEPAEPTHPHSTPMKNIYGTGKSQKKYTELTPETLDAKRKHTMCPSQSNFEARKAMRTTIESIQKGINEGSNICNKSLSSAIRNMTNTFNVEHGVPLSLMMPPRIGYRCVMSKGKTLRWVKVVCTTADTIVVQVEHNLNPIKTPKQWIFHFNDGEWGCDNATLII